MALNGNVTFTAGGEDYTLAFTINALVILEDQLGVPATQLGDVLGGAPKIGDIRTVFWAGLQAYHGVSHDQAGEIMSEIGIAETGALITKAFTAAFPEAGRSTARPQRAAGTGKPS